MIRQVGWIFKLVMCLSSFSMISSWVQFYLNGLPEFGAWLAGIELAVIVFGWCYILAPVTAWTTYHEGWPEGSRDAQPQIRKGRKARNPLRSRWLGWTLKLLGIAYLVVIAPRQVAGIVELVKRSEFQGVLVAAAFGPAILLIYVGYRLCPRRYEPAKRGDTRKPILFLRPFEDDLKTTLQPTGILSAVTGVRQPGMQYAWRSRMEGWLAAYYDMFLIIHPVRILRMLLDYGVGTSEESLVRHFEIIRPGHRHWQTG